MIDLLYLCHGRRQFTETTLANLLATTNWDLVNEFVVYNDAATDGHETTKLLHELLPDGLAQLRFTNLRSPVGVMNHFMWRSRTDAFVKIDNDIMVPPGWLEALSEVMEHDPQLDLLGMEPGQSAVRAPDTPVPCYTYSPARWIGGVGMMRKRPFYDHPWPRPNGRFGFTEWQQRYKPLIGWIEPDLRMFALDQLPFEPWQGITQGYRGHEGLQRDWPRYDPDMHFYWDWAEIEMETEEAA